MTSMLPQALPQIRALEPYQPGKPIDELERELGIHGAIKLASNENPLGASPRACAALAGLDALTLARYPDGAATRLRAGLAARLGLAPSMITLGNGSSEVLELAVRAFAGAGDAVVCAEYAFSLYPLLAQAAGAQLRTVPARDFGHDLPAMAAACADARLVFVANPNNPTGTWVDGETLEAFLKAVPPQVVVVLDEAYREYVQQPGYVDTGSWIARFPNLIITRTFSKIYGLAGLRIGYGLSTPAMAEVLNRIRPPFNTSEAAQRAALAALDDAAFVRASQDLNATGLRVVTEGLERLGLPVLPSVGNFVSFEVGPAAEVFQQLLRAGVIVRPLANYGMPRHLRVTIGTPEENARFLEALAGVLGRA
ncbi:MAG TPA: histidinol-phosphate transaminase [Acidiferrobacteraceae bacterium]|nr:histidinol-phosphate transaminase [Acidiferrobacteraceae bacterium]